jgi:hypothetical protein
MRCEVYSMILHLLCMKCKPIYELVTYLVILLYDSPSVGPGCGGGSVYKAATRLSPLGL